MARNVIVASDKYKGCLSSPEVCRLISRGLNNQLDDKWNVISCPQADGGEGTVKAVVEARDGEIITSAVQGPRRKEVKAEWGWIAGEHENSAIIEMASASGLALLGKEKQNPLKTTTLGTGQLIRRAAEKGADKILLGIGGSATVDGGTGVAEALGYRLLDDKNKPVKSGGGNLAEINKIDDSKVPSEIKNLEVKVACDVTNPLLGPEGAAQVYGPQKGASEEMVKTLEENMTNWADVLEDYAGKKLRNDPGTGAAGGLGFGLMGLLDAQLTSGARLVGEVTGLNSLLEDADVLITGEGKIDEQTAYGKTPAVVAESGRENNVRLIIGLAGALVGDIDKLYDDFDLLFGLPNRPITLEESMKQTKNLLPEWGNILGRIIKKISD
ncbi:MAG: glycerate kinase [bacterium]